MSTLSARQTILLVVIFVVTSISFIALDNRQALDPVKTGVQNLIVPVTDLMNGLTEDSGDETALQIKYDELQEKYDIIQAEYAKLLVNSTTSGRRTLRSCR